MPGPAQTRREFLADPEKANKACEGCHADIAAEWRPSAHGIAHSDPRYREALALEPLSFCEGCHAPEASPKQPPSKSAAHTGVGCITCHRVDGDPGAVLAAPTTKASARSAAPHRITREARFGQRDACAGCHEFAFADGRPWRELMQSTASEHARSSQKNTPCADCHMPRTGTDHHRSHAVTVSPAMVRGALSVRVSRAGPTRIKLVLTPTKVGHAMPTGDLFRRLAVEARPHAGGPREPARRYLARHFRTSATGAGSFRTLSLDDRPGSKGTGSMTIELEVDASAKGRAVDWIVRYEKVSHPRSEREQDALVGDAVTIAQGSVAP